jgi:hypothetical protein
MKKIVFFIIFLALLYGGYIYLDAVIRFEKLSNRIDLIISEPQSKSIESLKKAFIREAATLNIPLSHDELEIIVTETEKRAIGEMFVERPGIDAESKLLIVRFSHPIEIFGIRKDLSFREERVFTSHTTLAIPNHEDFIQ